MCALPLVMRRSSAAVKRGGRGPLRGRGVYAARRRGDRGLTRGGAERERRLPRISFLACNFF